MASNRDRSFHHRVAQSVTDRGYNASLFLAHHTVRKETKKATVAKVSTFQKLKEYMRAVWAKLTGVFK